MQGKGVQWADGELPAAPDSFDPVADLSKSTAAPSVLVDEADSAASVSVVAAFG